MNLGMEQVGQQVNNENRAVDECETAGTQTAGMIMAGSPYSALTEEFDGISWTEVADMSTGRQGGGGAGPTSTLAMFIGGNTSPGVVNSTEEWTKAQNVEIITD